MAKINKNILEQVPEDYYFQGMKKNLFQYYWHTRKWKKLKNFLMGSKGSLLDIGCADGTTTYFIQKTFPKLKISGIDLYRKSISFAKARQKEKKSMISFICADAHNLPFPRRKFETVVALEVLEHLKDPDRVLLEINRVLKKNGKLIIAQDTNSLLFNFIWWIWGKSKGSVWKNSHINCCKPKELITKLKKAQFRVTKQEFHQLGMEVFLVAKKT